MNLIAHNTGGLTETSKVIGIAHWCDETGVITEPQLHFLTDWYERHQDKLSLL